MAVLFRHKRLHVGFRKRDWTDVWYEPIGDWEEDEEGAAQIGLFKLTTGEAGHREPMAGEVHWHPEFDPKIFDSNNARERKEMQKQFLTDAYRYLVEQDPEKVKDMEEVEFHYPEFRKWTKWFEHAKKYKKQSLKRKEATRRRRARVAREAGATEEEIAEQINSDSSDDEGYEGDEEERAIDAAKGARRLEHDGMPPPPRPDERKRKNSRESRASPDLAKRRRLSKSPSAERKRSPTARTSREPSESPTAERYDYLNSFHPKMFIDSRNPSRCFTNSGSVIEEDEEVNSVRSSFFGGSPARGSNGVMSLPEEEPEHTEEDEQDQEANVDATDQNEHLDQEMKQDSPPASSQKRQNESCPPLERRFGMFTPLSIRSGARSMSIAADGRETGRKNIAGANRSRANKVDNEHCPLPEADQTTNNNSVSPEERCKRLQEEQSSRFEDEEQALQEAIRQSQAFQAPNPEGEESDEDEGQLK